MLVGAWKKRICCMYISLLCSFRFYSTFGSSALSMWRRMIIPLRVWNKKCVFLFLFTLKVYAQRLPNHQFSTIDTQTDKVQRFPFIHVEICDFPLFVSFFLSIVMHLPVQSYYNELKIKCDIFAPFHVHAHGKYIRKHFKLSAGFIVYNCCWFDQCLYILV